MGRHGLRLDLVPSVPAKDVLPVVRPHLGETHAGPKALELKNVPIDRLPRYARKWSVR